MTFDTDRNIALWFKKITPLNEFKFQDSAKIQAFVSEIEALLHDLNQKNQGHIASASGFLIAMGLRKLFVMGDETVKENIRALYLMRFRTDPQYLEHRNQSDIAYANAPLFLVITQVLRNEDLFRYEPHASLLQQLTAAVSDVSYWIKKDDITPVVSRESLFVESGSALFKLLVSQPAESSSRPRTPSPFSLDAPTPSELERRLGLN